MNFKELKIDEDLVLVLNKNGINTPTEIQEKAIPIILNGEDVIGEAQTGTGKTLSFLLPMFQEIDLKNKNIQGLIISPTRELAIQITEECNKLSKGKEVNVLSLYGGKDMAGQLKKLNTNVHIVVATPGRLIDHIEKGNINLKNVKTVVLDEADQMLLMGFRNEIDKIMTYVPKKKKMLCFSATMDSKVKKLAYRYMNNPKIISVSNNDKVTLDEIKQEVVFTTDRWKRNALCKALEEDNPFMAIIFCRTKRRADELEEYMARGKFNCEKIHSDIKQSKRERLMKNFREAKIQYLIATDVAARGIDIEGVDYIYNYDAPETPESYIHRIGRTGRQGAKGYTCMFIADKDKSHLKAIQEMIEMEIPERNVEIIK
ncbi:DEAD/DEAH box helicase [uncultured Clostridium sp.]|uniref:DEAD/DEAH box helicase n=1 Tax=uncultured Clostridium sp. TaxID=59620 RepID=UPI00260D5443|nr:DEAD/DEAH box helicase [uncultured Clostridium sp.]